MDEETWIAAMRANPYCIRTMAAFSDWLQERGDERWRPLAWMVDRKCVGEAMGYRSENWREIDVRTRDNTFEYEAYVPHEWFARSLNIDRDDYTDNIGNRMALLAHWLPGDTGG